MRRASRNIPGVEIVPAAGVNVYSILRRDILVLTKPALDLIIERLRRPINRLGAAGLAFRARLEQRQLEQAQQQRRQQWLQPAPVAAAVSVSGSSNSNGG
jgi:ribosomal protein L4